jgi:type IV pilus assembly protein PilA
MLVKEVARRAKRRGGFSLVELMVVVAIIAILAAVAIPQYKKYQLKAKTSEAKVNIGAIRSLEEAYSVENDYYVLTNWAPGTIPGTAPTKFTEAGDADKKGFDKIGFAPSGKVYYSYAVLNSENKTADEYNGSDNSTELDGIQVEITNSTDIRIWAIGDLDSDGNAEGNPDPSKLGNNGAFMSTDEDPKIYDKNPGHF